MLTEQALRRDARALLGGALLAAAILVAALAPLITAGNPAGQHDVVATR